MRRIWRGLLIVLVVLLVVGVVLIVAGRYYLSSPQAAARVTAGLEAQYGGPVRVGHVEIGLQQSSVHDLKLYEANAEPGAVPWATFANIRADVSLASLASGAAHVRRLDVTGADLTLRFDRDGHFLTRLPQRKESAAPLPAIHIHQGRVTIDQEGRHPFTVGGVDAEVRSDEGRLVLTGTIHDERWGAWGVTGNVDPASGAATGTLKSDNRIHVTQQMLTDLPFVGASVWENVQAEGDTPVIFTLGYQPDKHAVHYRVELDPENTHVHVTSIDLTGEQASGNVIIEDSVVHLAKVRGKVADGTLGTDAELDFRPTPNRLTFKINAENLDLVKLPKAWKIPPQLEGQLSGHADLVVTIRDGHAHTNGDGEGVIDQARVWGLPSHPIRLRLFSEGTGFRFGTPKSPEGRLPRWAAATVVLLAAPPGGGATDPVLTPGEAANRASNSVLDAAGGLVGAGERLLRAVPTRSRLLPGGPNPDTPGPSFLEANLALDDVDLAKLTEQLKLNLPVPVSGRVSVGVRVAFPINTPGDMRAYRVNGTATSPQLSVAGVELRQLQAKVNYADGVLHLEELRGRVPSARQSEEGAAVVGSFEGSARLDVAPPGEANASLTLDRVPLDRALALLPGPAPHAEGAVSGTVAARAPASRLEDVTAWAANGHLETDRLAVYGLTLADARTDVRLDHGELSLPTFAGKLAGAPLRASGRLDLREHYRYHAHLDLKGTDLGALEHLVPDLRPPVAVGGRADLGADVDGTLSPLTWDAKGTADARELRLDTLTAANVQFHWDATPDRLRLTDLRARLYRGDVTGSATVPLGVLRSSGPKKEQPGEPGRVQLDFKDLDVGASVGDLLTAATPAREQTGGRRAPVPIQGQADGTLTATLPPDRRDLSAKIELRSSRLRVQGLLTERLRGTLGNRNGVFEYHLEGSMAGGTIRLEGTAPSRSPAPGEGTPSKPPEAAIPRDVILVRQAAAPAGEGRLRVQGAQLGRLLEDLGIPASRVPLRGTVDLDLPYRQESIGSPPTGTGRLAIHRLRWQQDELAGELTSTVRLTARELVITDLSAIVGQGVLRGRIGFPLRGGDRGSFSLALDNVEAARLVAPWPDLAGRVEGPVDMALRGTIDHEWAGSGEVTLLRGRVLGVEVTDWSVPIDFVIIPSRGAGQVNVRDTSADVALGRLTGRASLSFDAVNRLEGSLRFSGVDLPTLLRQWSDQSQIGPGKVTGRIEFAANDLRSLNDLSATIEASLQQTQAMNYPVLQQIAPFLGPLQSSSSYRNGDLRARLDRGVLRIQRLTLVGSNLQLFIDGTVTVPEGRLGLNVTANTGRVGYNPTFLRFLGLRIPTAGPIPVSLILEASTYLSNRTVHLRVTGTIRNPSVQVEPVSLLSEETVRFFINRTPLPVP
jgi:translocation and assembly module TamB